MLKRRIGVFYFPMLNNSQLKRILVIFSLFMVLGHTFSYHIHPYRMYYHELLVFLGLIMMVGYCACNSQLEVSIPKSIILPVTLIVVIAVQLLKHSILYPVEMIFPFLYLVGFAVAMIGGATIARHENGLIYLSKFLAWSFLAIGLISVAFQHLQLCNFDLMPWVDSLEWASPLRPYANYAQANSAALALCFALAAVWYLSVTGSVRLIVAGVVAVLLLWGLALTQSRIGWIILPLFIPLVWTGRDNSAHISRVALVVLFLLFVAFVMVVPTFLHMIGGVSESVADRAGQTSVRLVLWQQALAMSAGHPWFGVGWYQFGPNQVLISRAFQPTEYSDYAHNIVLNFAAEIGWPLTLIFLAVVIWWICRCCFGQWKIVQVRFISLVFVAIGVHSMVEFPLWYGLVLIPFGLMVGALHVQKLGYQAVQIGRAWIVGVTVLAIGLVGVITWDYNRVVVGFATIKSMQEGNKPDTKLIAMPDYTLFPEYFDYFHIVEVKVVPKMPPEDIQFLGKISLRFAFAPVLERLAMTYIDNLRPNEALQVLIVLSRLQVSEYDQVYKRWKQYAQENPVMYGEVVKRMPKPVE